MSAVVTVQINGLPHPAHEVVDENPAGPSLRATNRAPTPLSVAPTQHILSSDSGRPTDGTGRQLAAARRSLRRSRSHARTARPIQPRTSSAGKTCTASRTDKAPVRQVNVEVDTGGAIVRMTDGEPILRGEEREISILLARRSHDHPRALRSGRTGRRCARPSTPMPSTSSRAN
jgi:hypothetical protein